MKPLAWYLCGLLFLTIAGSLASGLRVYRAVEMAPPAAPAAVPVSAMTHRYDDHFRKFARTYFGRIPWEWFKAQAIQESRLNPYARSQAGAMGLMQIMPATFEEIRGEIGLLNMPWDPRTNIHAGIYYNLKCSQVWSEWRLPRHKMQLMFAAYNAGAGNILEAQKVVRSKDICRGRNWGCIQKGLPSVTGENAAETIQYVDRIEQIYRRL